MDELTKFGIGPQDEGPHPVSPDHEWWNESWFLDFFDAEGTRAGHVRIGLHPNQDRCFFWALLYEDGEWLVLEEPRLPLGDVGQDALAYDKWGLRFRWDRTDPLRAGRLEVSGFGRVVSGPRAGLVLPFSIALDYETAGAAHSSGPADVPGHSAEGYTSNRFEQAISVRGEVGIGAPRPFVGRGERDHSWGPRAWDMEWLFTVIGGDDFRLQWALVTIEGTTESVTAVDADIHFGDDDLTAPVEGRFAVTTADGSTLSGVVETIAGMEIDITHTFSPPRATVYRRTLVRFTPDDGRAPAMGWIESNRFAR
jgi:hypothetical protein